jgi:carbon starvation protein
MNSLFIALIGIILIIAGYIFYGKKLEKLWEVDPEKPTPAFTCRDNCDYIPAKNWFVLFGHHFSSIAGAGPILGPVIAVVAWGWLPALLWVIFGTIFIGGVHDFSSLMVSVRHKSESVAAVAEDLLGKKLRLVLLFFFWVTLILVIAVFAAVTAQTLEIQPGMVIPTFGLIFDAILIGYLLYHRNSPYPAVTVLGLLILVFLIIFGYQFPILLPSAGKSWTAILLVYCLIASVTPVNILLQPRDYLSAFLLFFGLLAGLLGLFLVHPVINAPAYIGFKSETGILWPMLFVTIACGAISGFHSLVASGTSSKQLPSEKDARKIGYGAMAAEGVLAVIAIMAVAAGLRWQGTGLTYPVLIKEKGWIPTFAAGYQVITKPLLGGKGDLVAILILNGFVLTTLDTATRICRYIGQELFGTGLKIKLFRNNYLATIIPLVLAAYLAFGNWKMLWPVFGAANQLIAALVLLLVSCYLLSRKKPVKTTLVPAIFMLLTTVFALGYQANKFYHSEKYFLGSISLLLLILAIYVTYQTTRFLLTHRKYRKP